MWCHVFVVSQITVLFSWFYHPRPSHSLMMETKSDFNNMPLTLTTMIGQCSKFPSWIDPRPGPRLRDYLNAFDWNISNKRNHVYKMSRACPSRSVCENVIIALMAPPRDPTHNYTPFTNNIRKDAVTCVWSRWEFFNMMFGWERGVWQLNNKINIDTHTRCTVDGRHQTRSQTRFHPFYTICSVFLFVQLIYSYKTNWL